jgi:hypothetical protein
VGWGGDRVGRGQREAMGLLESQAMPSLRDVAHEGWYMYIYYITAAGIPSARSLAAPVRAIGTVQKRQGGMARSSRTKSPMSGHSPPASHAGRRVVPAL